jgi:hypothetical protein
MTTIMINFLIPTLRHSLVQDQLQVFSLDQIRTMLTWSLVLDKQPYIFLRGNCLQGVLDGTRQVNGAPVPPRPHHKSSTLLNL